MKICSEEKKIVYLASPYTHSEDKIMETRFIKISKFAAHLMKEEGIYVFSPISHSHPIASVGEIPRSWNFWSNYDTIFLNLCNSMIVYMLDGWKESVGVQNEIAIMNDLGKTIKYYEERQL